MDCCVIKEILLNRLDTLSLFFNFLGAFFIIAYISIDFKEYVEGEGKPGERWYSLFTKHPNWLCIGVILITIGFFLGLIDSLFK